MEDMLCVYCVLDRNVLIPEENGANLDLNVYF